jgi:hypothetical protein
MVSPRATGGATLCTVCVMDWSLYKLGAQTGERVHRHPRQIESAPIIAIAFIAAVVR